MRTLVCECGKEFQTKHSRQIHCSRRCRNQKNANSPQWNARQRDYKYRWNYGISLENYNELFDSQNGCCAICEIHQSDLGKSMHVDHDHKTGEIRGLLCQRCNQALGLFKDSPKIMLKAVEYVS